MGGTLVLGMGSAQAAMAGGPPPTVQVPCSADALASAISNAISDETIALQPGCAYRLRTALPTVTVSMKIVGFDSELVGNRPHPGFPLLSVGDAVDLTVVNVDFKDGGGGSILGGAIDIVGCSDVTVDGGIFTDNYAGDDYGGAIYTNVKGDNLTVNGAYFIGNDTGDYGGAIYNYGTATINDSTFKNNTSPDEEGGAVYNEGTMVINDSTFTGNSAYYGAAIYDEPDPTPGSLVLNRDDITGNLGGEGGGLYTDGYTTTVNNSLIDFNFASDNGGGIYRDSGTATASRSRIYGNQPNNCVDVTGCLG